MRGMRDALTNKSLHMFLHVCFHVKEGDVCRCVGIGGCNCVPVTVYLSDNKSETEAFGIVHLAIKGNITWG
jgi:hypothetical protein